MNATEKTVTTETPVERKKLKPLRFFQSINLGCDPEFFFENPAGEIVGSEKILAKKAGHYNGDSECVVDGVQAEINPTPSNCRESLANQICYCFRNLKATLEQKGLKFAVRVDPLVDITQAELDSLSADSRVFGCAPSVNVYTEGEDKTSKIKVDAATYLKRSAGGHLHLGNYYQSFLSQQYDTYEYRDTHNCAKRTEKALKEMADVMVPILDIVVGNTCVLMDRCEGNKERRANYGRVGEYRIKKYGLEYRSLSNFWLRSYPLMSFVFGMARIAVHLVEQSTPENDYVKALFDAVPRMDIVKAVNENDYDLALQNFKKIEQILLEAAASGSDTDRYYPIKAATIKLFYHFVKRINRKGLQYWFPQDALTHWTGSYNEKGGWETFANSVVYDDMIKHQAWLRKRKAQKLAEAQAADALLLANQ
jgi:hypothetical protein